MVATSLRYVQRSHLGNKPRDFAGSYTTTDEEADYACLLGHRLAERIRKIVKGARFYTYVPYCISLRRNRLGSGRELVMGALDVAIQITSRSASFSSYVNSWRCTSSVILVSSSLVSTTFDETPLVLQREATSV